MSATYSGDPTYAAQSASGFTDQMDGTAASTVVVSSSANPSAYNAQVTLTATVTGSGTPDRRRHPRRQDRDRHDRHLRGGPAEPDGGGRSPPPTCTWTPPVSGNVGVKATITATYSGDPTYTAKASAAFTPTAAGTATPTGFTLTSSKNPVAHGTAVSFTATLTGSPTPTGTVPFFVNATAVCTSAINATTGKAICSWTPASAGSYTVTAAYSGDVTYAAEASPGSITEVVT